MKLIAFVILLLSASCGTRKENTQGDWIKGSEEEKIKIIEKQFRGFDNAMVETGYRYQELYWAGQDQNWEYAKYQLEKIRITIGNGLQRRPNRARSAEQFLNVVLPQMKQAVDANDTSEFNKNFLILTSSCNSCHLAEKVPFFTVAPPTGRQSPVQK
jgi:CRISPR/Cas system CSM-associated protein Csm2 small subunit